MTVVATKLDLQRHEKRIADALSGKSDPADRQRMAEARIRAAVALPEVFGKSAAVTYSQFCSFICNLNPELTDEDAHRVFYSMLARGSLAPYASLKACNGTFYCWPQSNPT